MPGCLRLVASVAIMIDKSAPVKLVSDCVVHIQCYTFWTLAQHMAAAHRSGFEAIILSSPHITVKGSPPLHPAVCWSSKQEVIITLTVLLISRMTIQKLPWPLNMFNVHRGKSTFDTSQNNPVMDWWIQDWVCEKTNRHIWQAPKTFRENYSSFPMCQLCVNKISKKRLSFS